VPKGVRVRSPPGALVERSPSPAYGASLLMMLGIASLASSNLARSALQGRSRAVRFRRRPRWPWHHTGAVLGGLEDEPVRVLAPLGRRPGVKALGFDFSVLRHLPPGARIPDGRAELEREPARWQAPPRKRLAA
jgi:hypothetical protein